MSGPACTKPVRIAALVLSLSACSPAPVVPQPAFIPVPVEAKVLADSRSSKVVIDAIVIGVGGDDVRLDGPRVEQPRVFDADGSPIRVTHQEASGLIQGASVELFLKTAPSGSFVFLSGWLVTDGVFAGRYALPPVARVLR